MIQYKATDIMIRLDTLLCDIREALSNYYRNNNYVLQAEGIDELNGFNGTIHKIQQDFWAEVVKYYPELKNKIISYDRNKQCIVKGIL